MNFSLGTLLSPVCTSGPVRAQPQPLYSAPGSLMGGHVPTPPPDHTSTPRGLRQSNVLSSNWGEPPYYSATRAFTFRYPGPRNVSVIRKWKDILDRDTLQNANLPGTISYLEAYYLAPFAEVVGGCVVFEEHVTAEQCTDLLAGSLWGPKNVWTVEHFIMPKLGRTAPYESVNARCTVYDEVYVYENGEDGSTVSYHGDCKQDFIFPGDCSVLSNHVIPTDSKMLFVKGVPLYYDGRITGYTYPK